MNYNLPASAELWKQGQRALGPSEIRDDQCRLGEVGWRATVPRPDMRSRPSVVAPNTTHLQMYDVYRVNDLSRAVKQWQEEEISPPDACAVRWSDACMVGWADAVSWGRSKDGKCRLVYVFGSLPASLDGSRHVFHWSARVTRRAVSSRLGGEFSHSAKLLTTWTWLWTSMNSFSPARRRFWAISPKKAGAGICLVRHSSAIQDMVRHHVLRNVFLDKGAVQSGMWPD